MRLTFRGQIIRRISAAIAAGLMLFCFSGVALAQDLSAEIAALKVQSAQQQAQAAQLAGVANDYQSRVNQLQAQINALQSQINLSQAQYNQISQQIATNQAKLETAKTALGANLKNMYITGNETPLEMLASSQSLGDYFNQQQYQDSVKDKIQSAMSTILALQQQLAAQQKQVADLLATQKGQQDQLSAQRAQVSQILALAQQNADAANQQVRSTNAQLAQKQAAQAAALAAHFGSPGSVATCGGGYPYCGAPFPNSMSDPWGMFMRQCVSYTAFRVANSGRYMPYWGGRGNANQWPSNATSAGIPVDHTPRAGDVAIAYIGEFGHAMYVENASGGNVTVSQYNYGNDGKYSTMTISASGLDFIHFR